MRIAKPALLDELDRGHDVIEASAGTGKTFTLERLVADQVLRGTPLERVLVVTYTEKAALELRTRVRSFLESLLQDPREDLEAPSAWELDAEAQVRIATALRTFDRATLSTIHGFCRQVLQEAALERGALFEQELVDERALFARAFHAQVASRFTVGAERDLLVQALSSGWTMAGLEDLLWQVHADGGRPNPAPGAWEAARRAVVAASGELGPDLEAQWKAAKVHAGTVKAALQHLGALVSLAPESDPWRLALGLEKVKGESLAKAGDTCPGSALVEAGLALLAQGPTPEAVLVHTFLAPVSEDMERIAQTEGLMTFSAMVRDVALALEGPSGESLAARLRRRYDLALVDEFQDTDPLQWRIFQHIFGHGGRLVLIGDPKQAIYGFRGGDLPTYQAACRTLLQGRPPKRLTHNFRSTPAVINTYNQILGGVGHCEPEAFFGAPAPGDPPLYPEPVGCGRKHLAAWTAEGAISPVDLFEVDTTQGGAKLWRRVALHLAAHLRQLKASGIRLGTKEESRELGWGDMQILVGKGTEGAIVAKALREAGIPCAFYKQRGLFTTREASDWLDLLRAVADPRNRSLVARALVSPFFGYSLEERAALPDLPEDHPALMRLLDWHQRSQGRHLASLLGALLDESGVARRLLLCQQGQRALVNLRHLADLMAQAVERSGLDLDDLVRQLARWQTGDALPPAEEGDLQRLEGEADAVQILTLHASKGLEAPIVAIFAFGQGSKSSVHRYHEGGERCLWLGTQPEVSGLKARVDAEEDEERRRLLYVALTRAQAKLVLYTFRELGKEGLKGLKGPAEVLNRRLLTMDPPLPAEDLPWSRLEHLEEAPPVNLDGATLPELPSAPVLEVEAIRHRARPFLTTSFTALSHHGADAGESPRGDRDHVGVTPSEGDLPRGTHVGQALHEILEEVDPAQAGAEPLEAWSTRPEVLAIATRRLILHGLDPVHAPQALALVHAALSTPLPGAGKPLAAADHLLRELDFFTRFVDADRFPRERDLLKGSIDALFEVDGRVYLLDWKSNLLPDYGQASLQAVVDASYRLQAQVYLRASLAFLDIHDEAAYEARFGGIHYVFLRGLPEGGLWFHRPSWAEAQGWMRELEALHAEVTRG